jgi:hypothetical protein
MKALTLGVITTALVIVVLPASAQVSPGVPAATTMPMQAGTLAQPTAPRLDPAKPASDAAKAAETEVKKAAPGMPAAPAPIPAK